MSDGPDPPAEGRALVRLSPRQRTAGVVVAVGLAILHVVFPDIAIDAVFLGLLAFGAFIWFFDLKSLSFQGLEATRREIAEASMAVRKAPAAQYDVKVLPPEPALQSGDESATEKESLTTVHSSATDLNVPEDPTRRLIWGAEQVRIELIILAGNTGRLGAPREWSDYQSVPLAESLASANVIPNDLVEPIALVVRLRNSVVQVPAVGRLVRDVSDLAMDVLAKLREVKRQYFRVRDGSLVVYRDQSLTTPHANRAVMLAILDDDGRSWKVGVYPSSRLYVRGRLTSWEWNGSERVISEAWYRDPKTKETQLAWSRALFFAGREYPEQWGLEYRLVRADAGLD